MARRLNIQKKYIGQASEKDQLRPAALSGVTPDRKSNEKEKDYVTRHDFTRNPDTGTGWNNPDLAA
jgi:hypothetical protein